MQINTLFNIDDVVYQRMIQSNRRHLIPHIIKRIFINVDSCGNISISYRLHPLPYSHFNCTDIPETYIVSSTTV
jgi:hypothetical protein